MCQALPHEKPCPSPTLAWSFRSGPKPAEKAAKKGGVKDWTGGAQTQHLTEGSRSECPAQSGAVHPTVLTCFWLLGKDGNPREVGLASPSPNLPQPAAEVSGDILTLRDQEEKECGADCFCSSSSLSPHPMPSAASFFPRFIFFLYFTTFQPPSHSSGATFFPPPSSLSSSLFLPTSLFIFLLIHNICFRFMT